MLLTVKIVSEVVEDYEAPTLFQPGDWVRVSAPLITGAKPYRIGRVADFSRIHKTYRVQFRPPPDLDPHWVVEGKDNRWLPEDCLERAMPLVKAVAC